MTHIKTALVAFGGLFIAGAAFADGGCKYKGTAYSHGSAVCQAGSQYRCDDGEWNGLSVTCAESPPIGGKTCAFNDNSYSTGSTTCQAGTQYRCDEGAWTSLSVACMASGQVATCKAPPGTCMYNGATVATKSTMDVIRFTAVGP